MADFRNMQFFNSINYGKAFFVHFEIAVQKKAERPHGAFRLEIELPFMPLKAAYR